jgi:hypothetical protein
MTRRRIGQGQGAVEAEAEEADTTWKPWKDSDW